METEKMKVREEGGGKGVLSGSLRARGGPMGAGGGEEEPPGGGATA